MNYDDESQQAQTGQEKPKKPEKPRNQPTSANSPPTVAEIKNDELSAKSFRDRISMFKTLAQNDPNKIINNGKPNLPKLMSQSSVKYPERPKVQEIQRNISVRNVLPVSVIPPYSPPEPVSEYNILLLGESGAGKSTTINAIANYLKYETIAEAKQNELVNLISSYFTLPNPQTGEPLQIQSCEDVNEQNKSGSSSTQDPRTYYFQMNDWRLRIIDTPRVGDTSGVDVDNKNFEKVLNHLHAYKQLHGICFLVKSTDTRQTAYFKYCITELLTHLHKSACKNIIFCFTFSRNSFYGPGEGFHTLQSFLKNELKSVQIELKVGENCFFIDNEAYRYLVALHQGYSFAENVESSYLESWNKSVEQVNKMWDQIKRLHPHELFDTVSMNNARKLILQLAEPLVKLQNNINANIEHIKIKTRDVVQSKMDRIGLAQSLFLQVDDLESVELAYPTTVCTASSCTEVVQFQGQVKHNYKTRCHEPCYLESVQTNVVGHEILRSCAAMGGTLNCVQCGCPWQMHMHTTCEYHKVKRTIIDANKEREIKSTDEAIERIEQAVNSMRYILAEYQQEYQVIQDICLKFAYILTSISITPHNQFIEPYLQLLIDEEEKKINSVLDYPRDTYQSLIRMKEAHQKNVETLTKAMERSTKKVQLEDIFKYRDQLYGLKHTGPQISQMMRANDKIKTQMFANGNVKSLDFRKSIVQ